MGQDYTTTRASLILRLKRSEDIAAWDEFGTRPIATAFRVILRHGKNEYEIGTVTLAAQKKTFHTISSIIGTELIGKRVDVILRPDLASAETSTDIFEIWGEEIVFRDVVISHWREASHSK